VTRVNRLKRDNSDFQDSDLVLIKEKLSHPPRPALLSVSLQVGLGHSVLEA